MTATTKLAGKELIRTLAESHDNNEPLKACAQRIAQAAKQFARELMKDTRYYIQYLVWKLRRPAVIYRWNAEDARIERAIEILQQAGFTVTFTGLTVTYVTPETKTETPADAGTVVNQ